MKTKLLLFAAATAALMPLSPAQARPGPASSDPMASHHHHYRGGQSGVVGGALFGGTGRLIAGQRRLHRRLALVRVYYHLGETFPTKASSTLMGHGSTLLVSLDIPPSRGPGYAAIAAGLHDSAIRAFLEAMNRAAVRYHLAAIYICFQHEANGTPDLALGSPLLFARAWDHVHHLAQAGHLNWNDGGRLHWVLILMHADYMSNPPPGMRYRAGAYWPGDSNVDIVAADGYNHAGCKHHHQSPMVTPGTLFDPMLHFARAHGKPAFIAEWGSQSRSGQQPAFIRSMQHFVTVNRDIAAASYFDGRNHQTPACSNIVNGHPASMAALAVMGHAPRLRGHVARR